ncbi:MAG: hypothetical protein HYZ14_00480 [Bacteroidetes bacterium]|nr:hypothetical protein [Bacteroidota bacterium]
MFILIAAGVGLLGMIMPWASVWIVSQNGFNSGFAGWATLAGFGAAAGITFKAEDKNQPLDSSSKKVVMGGGAAAAFFSLLAMILLKSQGGGYLTLGTGVFLCFIAGAAVLAIPFIIKGDGNMQMPTKDSIKDELK